jgi:hypothetical protein
MYCEGVKVAEVDRDWVEGNLLSEVVTFKR